MQALLKKRGLLYISYFDGVILRLRHLFVRLYLLLDIHKMLNKNIDLLHLAISLLFFFDVSSYLFPGLFHLLLCVSKALEDLKKCRLFFDISVWNDDQLGKHEDHEQYVDKSEDYVDQLGGITTLLYFRSCRLD